MRRRDCSVVRRSAAAPSKRREAEVGDALLHAILSQFSVVAVSVTPRTTSRRFGGGEGRRKKNKQHACLSLKREAFRCAFQRRLSTIVPLNARKLTIVVIITNAAGKIAAGSVKDCYGYC